MPPKKSPQKLKFEQKQLEVFKRLHPDTPYAESFIKKFSDKDANSLTAMIVECVKLWDGQAERISNTGRFVMTKGPTDEVFNRNFDSGKYIKGSGTNGTADISATIKGLSCKIEVKYGKDRQSSDQKEYEAAVKAAGGVYYIAKDFDSFFDWHQNIISKLQGFSNSLLI